jgi:glutaredoxin-like protein DUF836
MREVVEKVADELSIAFVERDVRDDPELERRYLLEIPVLLVGAEVVARYRITPAELRDRLTRLGSGG